jgi:hypothetical protein
VVAGGKTHWVPDLSCTHEGLTVKRAHTVALLSTPLTDFSPLTLDRTSEEITLSTLVLKELRHFVDYSVAFGLNVYHE